MAVTVDDDAREHLRGDHDALPDASIGTVPILWYNADDGVGRDAATILDEIARPDGALTHELRELIAAAV